MNNAMHLWSSLPGLTRQSIGLRKKQSIGLRKKMDARVKPAHDALTLG